MNIFDARKSIKELVDAGVSLDEAFLQVSLPEDLRSLMIGFLSSVENGEDPEAQQSNLIIEEGQEASYLLCAILCDSGYMAVVSAFASLAKKHVNSEPSLAGILHALVEAKVAWDIVASLVTEVDNSVIAELFDETIGAELDSAVVQNPADFEFDAEIQGLSSESLATGLQISQINYEATDDRVQFSGNGDLEVSLQYGGEHTSEDSFPCEFDGHLADFLVVIKEITVDTSAFDEEGPDDGEGLEL